jgi:hypothetical protein
VRAGAEDEAADVGVKFGRDSRPVIHAAAEPALTFEMS